MEEENNVRIERDSMGELQVPADAFRIACSRSSFDLLDVTGLSMARIEVLEYEVAGAPKVELAPSEAPGGE